MTDATVLQYFTTASWLRGYASGLDAEAHEALAHKLNHAADLLELVYKYSIEDEGKNDD
jgi:hypothetical protein